MKNKKQKNISYITTPSGKFRFVVNYKSIVTPTKTFPTIKEGEAWGKEQIALIELNQHPKQLEQVKTPQTKTASDYTVQDCIEEYRRGRSIVNPIRQCSTDCYAIEALEKRFGHINLAELTASDILEWGRDRAKMGIKPGTINDELGRFKRIIEQGCLSFDVQIKASVFANATQILKANQIIGEHKKRDRRFSETELKKIFDNVPQPFSDICRIACILGLRRGEFTKLLWSDFKEDEGYLWVRDRKAAKKSQRIDSQIPLLKMEGVGDPAVIIRRQKNAKHLEADAGAKALADKYIFPVTLEKISDNFTEVCRKQNIEAAVFHDLRHECLSRWAEFGFSLSELQVISGHQSVVHLQRYVNLNHSHLTKKKVSLQQMQDSLKKKAASGGYSTYDPATTIENMLKQGQKAG